MHRIQNYRTIPKNLPNSVFPSGFSRLTPHNSPIHPYNHADKIARTPLVRGLLHRKENSGRTKGYWQQQQQRLSKWAPARVLEAQHHLVLRPYAINRRSAPTAALLPRASIFPHPAYIASVYISSLRLTPYRRRRHRRRQRWLAQNRLSFPQTPLVVCVWWWCVRALVLPLPSNKGVRAKSVLGKAYIHRL